MTNTNGEVYWRVEVWYNDGHDHKELHTSYDFNLQDAALQMYYWHQQYAPTNYDIKFYACEREK